MKDKRLGKLRRSDLEEMLTDMIERIAMLQVAEKGPMVARPVSEYQDSMGAVILWNTDEVGPIGIGRPNFVFDEDATHFTIPHRPLKFSLAGTAPPTPPAPGEAIKC